MWRIATWYHDDDIRYILKEINLIIMDASAGATGVLGAGGTPTPTKPKETSSGGADGATQRSVGVSTGMVNPFGYDGDG